MSPTPMTPPSSGSELNSPLVGRQANVSKRRRARRSSTSRFTWKNNHRRTLLVCHRRGLSSQDITRIFNSLYLDDCIVAGYQNGIASTTLQSQWQDHKKPTGKAWQKVLASSEAELDISRREIDEYLSKNGLHVQPTSAVRKRPSDRRWKISTTNNRVQTYDTHQTPTSTATTATTATVTHDQDTITVAPDPLTPPASPPSRSRKSVDQIRKPTQQVSVVIGTSVSASHVTGTQPTRKIFSKSPRTMITAERTRTVLGEQVSIIKATDPDLVVLDPVPPVEAHSPIPELLFRFYDDHSQGVRTPDGEICGKYAYQTCGPPSPLPCDGDHIFVSALNHLNRIPIASELISTTSNLFFAMRLAAKSDANPHICVIRGSALPKKKVYHLRPYHKRSKKHRLFINAQYRNGSSHEYAVWATIPEPAIIYDFTFADLERHLVGNPYMASIFRIHEMRTRKSSVNIQGGFQKDRLNLTFNSIGAIAKLMPTFGITVTSPAVLIARLISEIIRSFVIDLPKNTPAQWEMLGGAFAYALSKYAGETQVAEMCLIQVKEAFLAGVRTGLGKLNWHLCPKKQATMIRKGLSLGLGFNQAGFDMAAIASNKRLQNLIARYTYKEKELNLDQDMLMEEDTTLIGDGDMTDDEDEDEDEDEYDDEDDTLVENEDNETETNIEEHNENNVNTSPRSQHNAREASQSSNQHEPIIISDSSDDEDPTADAGNQSDKEDSSDIDELASLGPRLSQRMPSSSSTYNRPRRRSSRRRAQTPPIYNFSRADEVYYISDQSDDDKSDDGDCMES